MWYNLLAVNCPNMVRCSTTSWLCDLYARVKRNKRPLHCNQQWSLDISPHSRSKDNSFSGTLSSNTNTFEKLITERLLNHNSDIIKSISVARFLSSRYCTYLTKCRSHSWFCWDVWSVDETQAEQKTKKCKQIHLQIQRTIVLQILVS